MPDFWQQLALSKGKPYSRSDHALTATTVGGYLSTFVRRSISCLPARRVKVKLPHGSWRGKNQVSLDDAASLKSMQTELLKVEEAEPEKVKAQQ